MLGILVGIYLAIANATNVIRTALPFPATGQVRWYATLDTPASSARLTVTAPSRTPGRNYVVFMHNWDSQTLVAAIPVRAGETAAMDFPLGRYRLRIASGTTWQGWDHLFGLGTDRREALRPIEFTKDGQRWTGQKIELDKDFTGNLPTKPVWGNH